MLIFGDSLSAGYGIDVDQSWATLLQQRLRDQGYEHRVVNASISGETTEGGAERIGPALKNFDPELIILELGGNDGLRGFPPERMRGNLEKIIADEQETPAPRSYCSVSRFRAITAPATPRPFEAAFRDVG